MRRVLEARCCTFRASHGERKLFGPPAFSKSLLAVPSHWQRRLPVRRGFDRSWFARCKCSADSRLFPTHFRSLSPGRTSRRRQSSFAVDSFATAHRATMPPTSAAWKPHDFRNRATPVNAAHRCNQPTAPRGFRRAARRNVPVGWALARLDLKTELRTGKSAHPKSRYDNSCRSP